MFEPISLAVGAGILVVGWSIGRFGKRTGTRTTTARCGCGHDLALHDPEAGICHVELSRKSPYGLREWVRCGCRRYTGPVPVEDYFARPIMPPVD